MDENKRLKLVDIGYKINPSCALCSFGSFANDDWGDCHLNVYLHQKHTESKRLLSIHKTGSCNKFELDPEEQIKLGAFAEFLTK